MTEQIKLSDCYTNDHGPAYMTGTQALLRLLLEQARLDTENGINSRGLVSGYPGSPLGGFDLELTRNKDRLKAAGIVFQPAINEELAATAIWGSQHIHLYDQPEIDGVFGLWYGKGPGLDRALDALRHANMGGVAKQGGMVLAVGDDPTGKSSTIAYQSEQTLIAAGIPFFYPRAVNEIIPMGLQAFALSRFAGCCVGIKIVVDTADASAIVDMGAIRPTLNLPQDAGQVHIGRHDPALLREATLFNLRLPAVRAFQEKNLINAPIEPQPGNAKPENRKLGIIAVGKSLFEVNDALISLGINDIDKAGIGLFPITMPWPLNQQHIADFITRYDEVMIVEEKRPIVEEQIARIIVNLPDRAIITGKMTPDGLPLLPETGEITHAGLLQAIGQRAIAHNISVNNLATAPVNASRLPAIATRTPWYCAGCPHNTSTKLPDGEIVGMGIGCHSISGFLTPDEITNYTQMGGEGAFWVGRAPFSSHDHSFQNIGDGTYAHSGYLGIRAAVAAGVNMTFKILFNGAVAMTGGQAIEGGQPPWMISRQLAAEGVVKIAIVSDAPDDLTPANTSVSWASNSQIYHRRDILSVQADLKSIAGVTAIIYVQSCATELRRQRKRGLIADKPETVLINDAVCEGCGDCAVKSNCVAVKPAMRPAGEVRQIDQSLCNKDMSCLNGFCPSFVTVTFGTMALNLLPTARPAFPDDMVLPDPTPAKKGISNIFIAGIGGTGVSTLAGILIMAARIDGIAGTAVNQTGLSQKNGGVTSQIRLATGQTLDGHMVRLPTMSADLVIGCDAVVAANDIVLNLLNPTSSHVLLNANIDPVGVAGVSIGSIVDETVVMQRLGTIIDPARISKFDISTLANQLLGSTMSSNIIMVGWAIQNGLLPLGIQAVEKALKLNGTAIDQNLAALKWGRLLAVAPDRLFSLLDTHNKPADKAREFKSAAAAISYFSDRLTTYQNTAYAGKYTAALSPFMAQLAAQKMDFDQLGIKAARALYRAMAIKDEYEVARLLTSTEFAATIAATSGNDARISYYLAPPMLAWLKDAEGRPRKIRFGSWLTPCLRGLAHGSVLRETWLDPFGFSHERRAERAYRDQVSRWIAVLGANATKSQYGQINIALDLMLDVRGFGHVKVKRLAAAEPQITAIITQISAPPTLDITAE